MRVLYLQIQPNQMWSNLLHSWLNPQMWNALIGGGVNCIPCIVCCCCLVNKSCPTLCDPHGLWPARLLYPRDFPGKNTGVGCHFLLQGSYQPRDPIHISCTGKECRRCGLDPWVGKSPGATRESHSLYYSILDKVIEASAAFGIWEGSWNKSPKDMEGQVY